MCKPDIKGKKRDFVCCRLGDKLFYISHRRKGKNMVYEKPVMEVLRLEAADIIRASGGAPDASGNSTKYWEGGADGPWVYR